MDFVATQKAVIIEFDKPDFQWLLEGTKIMERMLHLIEMRKDNIVSIIRENSVLCHLTLSQITQFEEYLFRYEVKKGTSNANYVLFLFNIFSIKFYILILLTYILKFFVIFLFFLF